LKGIFFCIISILDTKVNYYEEWAFEAELGSKINPDKAARGA
jgi:hypothetical protein